MNKGDVYNRRSVTQEGEWVWVRCRVEYGTKMSKGFIL